MSLSSGTPAPAGAQGRAATVKIESLRDTCGLMRDIIRRFLAANSGANEGQ